MKAVQHQETKELKYTKIMQDKQGTGIHNMEGHDEGADQNRIRIMWHVINVMPVYHQDIFSNPEDKLVRTFYVNIFMHFSSEFSHLIT